MWRIECEIRRTTKWYWDFAVIIKWKEWRVKGCWYDKIKSRRKRLDNRKEKLVILKAVAIGRRLDLRKWPTFCQLLEGTGLV